MTVNDIRRQFIDYFVRNGEQCWWYGKAEHSRGQSVDHQLELTRLDNR